MKIGSTPPHSQPPLGDNTDWDQVRRPRSDERPGDVLQLSENVRSWLGTSENPQLRLSERPNGVYDEAGIRSKQTTADAAPKLDQIWSRMAVGYYNQPWVKEIIAGRLADELQEPPDSADSL